MTTKAGVGMSRRHNPNVAGREAAEQALGKASFARVDPERRLDLLPRGLLGTHCLTSGRNHLVHAPIVSSICASGRAASRRASIASLKGTA